MNSNSYPSILQEKSAVCEMAVQVVEQLTPVILLQPGTKRPVVNSGRPMRGCNHDRSAALCSESGRDAAPSQFSPNLPGH